jgi:hypothetical protein
LTGLLDDDSPDTTGSATGANSATSAPGAAAYASQQLAESPDTTSASVAARSLLAIG